MAVRQSLYQYAPVEAPIRRRSANRRSGGHHRSVRHDHGVLPEGSLFPFDGVDVWVNETVRVLRIQQPAAC